MFYMQNFIPMSIHQSSWIFQQKNWQYYAELMTKAGKGAYIVLEPIHEYTPPTSILK